MSDQILMENYLLILKSTVEVYVHGTLESSNNDIRKILKKGLTMVYFLNMLNIMVIITELLRIRLVIC